MTDCGDLGVIDLGEVFGSLYRSRRLRTVHQRRLCTVRQKKRAHVFEGVGSCASVGKRFDASSLRVQRRQLWMDCVSPLHPESIQFSMYLRARVLMWSREDVSR